MQNKISIIFQHTVPGTLRACINDNELYRGLIQNLDLMADEYQETNQLQLFFTDLDSQKPVVIESIYFNHLSIEHFIYQGFLILPDQTICPATQINQNGCWCYNFSKNLAREIIEANT
jgi:hypothetical protein